MRASSSAPELGTSWDRSQEVAASQHEIAPLLASEREPSTPRSVRDDTEDDQEPMEVDPPEAPPEPPARGPAQELLPMIMQLFHERRQTGATNDALVDHLCSAGSVVDCRIEAAFRAVDRAKFLPDTDGESAYDDSPIRSGHFHMSQPSLYADALGALELEAGTSFLNVGSGTGYLSSIVTEITGDALHHGIDVHEDILEHAREMLREQGKDYVQFFKLNVHDVDISLSPRYQRIYLGACCGGESKRILDLLEIGGILVGPFSTSSGQYIRRVRRTSETSFEVKNLKSVTFGTLVPPDLYSTKCALPTPAWTPETHFSFSKGFRQAVMTVLFSTTREESPSHIVPREIFVDHVFGYMHPRLFDEACGGQRTEVMFNGREREMGDEGDVDEELLRSVPWQTFRATLRTIAADRAPHQRMGEHRLTLEQFMSHLLQRHNHDHEGSEDDAPPANSDDEAEAGRLDENMDTTESEAPAAVEERPAVLPTADHGGIMVASGSHSQPSAPSNTPVMRRIASRGCEIA